MGKHVHNKLIFISKTREPIATYIENMMFEQICKWHQDLSFSCFLVEWWNQYFVLFLIITKFRKEKRLYEYNLYKM